MFKSKEEKPSKEACDSALGAVQDALYVLNGKWKLPVIIALSEGTSGSGDTKNVAGIAPKVLSAELKNLELNGFVIRKVYNEFPVLVEYELTEYSNSLENVITALKDWGLQHREKLRADYKRKRIKRVAAGINV